MRILLVTNDYPPKAGGIQQYLGSLVRSLGADVRVLAPHDDGPAPGEVARGPRRFMWPTRRVRRWILAEIQRDRPDVILFGAPHPLAHLGPRLRRETGIPFAVLCHGAEVTIPAAFPLTRTLVRWPLRRADALFAVSRFTAGRVRRLTGRDVTVIGAGVDVDAFAPGEPPAGFVVACVSRFVPRKGQDRVLRAAARLRAAGIGISVLLVGTGRDERRLRRLAGSLDVPVDFEVGVGWDRLPEMYRRASVFAMPCRSRWLGLEAEGLGLVFLEAAASGLPVLAGDSGGAPETVDPGVTGFVVADDAALDSGLRMLAAAPEWGRRMGSAGRRRVMDDFTWQAVADRVRDALATLPGRGPDRPTP